MQPKSGIILFSSGAIDSLLHPEGEDEVFEEVNQKDQAAYLEGVSDDEVSAVSKTDDDEEFAQYSAADQLKLLAIASTALERLGSMHPYAKSALHAYRTEIHLLMYAALHQTTILMHFKFCSYLSPSSVYPH